MLAESQGNSCAFRGTKWPRDILGDPFAWLRGVQQRFGNLECSDWVWQPWTRAQCPKAFTTPDVLPKHCFCSPLLKRNKPKKHHLPGTVKKLLTFGATKGLHLPNPDFHQIKPPNSLPWESQATLRRMMALASHAMSPSASNKVEHDEEESKLHRG